MFLINPAVATLYGCRLVNALDRVRVTTLEYHCLPRRRLSTSQGFSTYASIADTPATQQSTTNGIKSAVHSVQNKKRNKQPAFFSLPWNATRTLTHTRNATWQSEVLEARHRYCGAQWKHGTGAALPVPFFDQRNHAGECTPVIKLCALATS